MLGLAREQGARILQASTSEVYGNPEVHPQVEEYHGNVNPIGPRACYDEGKRCAETLFFDYQRMHGMEIKVARIFNTFGPRMDLQDGRVVTNFIMQAVQDEPITIYGDGSQTRSLCYVDDLVEGLIRLMNSAADITGPINLGNPTKELSMKELAETIIKLTASKSMLVFEPALPDDPDRRRPNISKAQSILGWEPKVSMEEGLQKTITYVKEKLK
jgi:UDP-glucuronate decarboxylase